jgi:hypothetical protein
LNQYLIDEQVSGKGSSKLLCGRGDRRPGGRSAGVVDENFGSTGLANPLRDSRGDLFGAGKIGNQNLMRLTGSLRQMSEGGREAFRVASQERDVSSQFSKADGGGESNSL